MSIVDNGIGMEKIVEKKIFHKYTKMDYNLSRRYDGAGLSLSVVKKYINLHGGKIKFKSKVNFGSVYSFYIPLKGMKFIMEM